MPGSGTADEGVGHEGEDRGGRHELQEVDPVVDVDLVDGVEQGGHEEYLADVTRGLLQSLPPVLGAPKEDGQKRGLAPPCVSQARSYRQQRGDERLNDEPEVHRTFEPTDEGWPIRAQ